MNKKSFQFLIVFLTVIFMILIYHISSLAFFDMDKEEKNLQTKIYKDIKQKRKLVTPTISAKEIHSTLQNLSHNGKELIFPSCNIANNNDNCIEIHYSVYDANSLQILLIPGMYQIPETHELPPKNCGFGKITYHQQKKEWKCLCYEAKYFGGKFCNEIQEEMIRNHHCTKIGQASNIQNTDVSTFNPIIDGVCIECESPKNQVPIIDALIPQCQEIDIESNAIDNSFMTDKNIRCFYDALSPHLFNSPNNKYSSGYGCVCDYHNGFVEAFLPNVREESNNIVSNACLKIATPDSSSLHTTDLGYYTLQNERKPIQVHHYSKNDLVYPFNFLFSKEGTLLVKQPNNMEKTDLVNENDWLNRHLKPTRKERIRRLNHPYDKWPIVNKKHLINYYQNRHETRPISAWKLAVGKGFETKHWYETTNDRFISNAVLGHPVIYTHYSKSPWNGKVTLNPLGIVYKQYYGLTMKTKPGEIVRLDTRGYAQEKEKDENIYCLAPDYQSEMMDSSKITYIALLYSSYDVAEDEE